MTKEYDAAKKVYKAEVGIMNLQRILLEDRHRQEYEGIEELADSIKQNGLVEPLCVMRMEGNET